MRTVPVVGFACLALAGCVTPPRPADELADLPARAQTDSALGRCPDARSVDVGGIANVVAEPEVPAERVQNGVDAVARDSVFRLVAVTLDDDQDPPFGNHGTFHAAAVVIIDTSGHPVRGSVVVTQSEGMVATRALCEALPHMVFHAARDEGRKVRSLYREDFVFYRVRDR